MKHLHTIPVPRGMTPNEAWAELCIMGEYISPDPYSTWANIECDGDECTSIKDDRE